MELGWGFGHADRRRPARRELGRDPDPGLAVRLLDGSSAQAARTGAKYGKANGSVRPADRLRGLPSTATSGRPGEAVIASIGQGYVTVTPLQLARAYVALANGGTLYSPRIGEALLSPTGKVVRRITPPVAGHLPVARPRWPTSGPRWPTCPPGAPRPAPSPGSRSASSAWPARPVPPRFRASWRPRCSPRSRRCTNPKYVVVMMIPNSGFGGGRVRARGPADLGRHLRPGRPQGGAAAAGNCRRGRVGRSRRRRARPARQRGLRAAGRGPAPGPGDGGTMRQSGRQGAA